MNKRENALPKQGVAQRVKNIVFDTPEDCHKKSADFVKTARSCMWILREGVLAESRKIQ